MGPLAGISKGSRWRTKQALEWSFEIGGPINGGACGFSPVSPLLSSPLSLILGQSNLKPTFLNVIICSVVAKGHINNWWDSHACYLFLFSALTIRKLC